MAKPKSQPSPQDDPQPDFEVSFERLEELVEAMEGESLPLEQLLAHHEEGSRLLKRCHQLLEAAEDRLREVSVQEPSAENSLKSESNIALSDNGTDPDSDDIRLF